MTETEATSEYDLDHSVLDVSTAKYKSDDFDKENDNNVQLTFKGNFWDVLAFAFCAIQGDLFLSWSAGLSNGFWDFFFVTVITCCCFLCIYLCLAEMSSLMPFSGGTYGFARVTVGPYLGFIIGFCESVSNIVFALVAMFPTGSTLSYLIHGDRGWEPLYWGIIYFVYIAMELLGRKWYFMILKIFAVVIIVILILYFVISIQYLQPQVYISSPTTPTLFSGGITELLPLLPISGWYFYGLEISPLVADEIDNTRTVTPKAIIYVLILQVVLSFVVMFFVSAQSTDNLDDPIATINALPLDSGFMNGFKLDQRLASIFSIPSLFIQNAIIIYGYGKQMKALGKSRLFPSIFASTAAKTNIPYISLIIGSLIGYAIMLIFHYGFNLDYSSPVTVNLFNSALIANYFVFFVMFLSFIIFRIKYSNLKREYKNPLGIPSAIFGIVTLLFSSAGLIGYSDDDYDGMKYFLGSMIVASLYYFGYARYYQRFSDEEQSILLKVYVMKANAMTRNRRKSRVSRPLRNTKVYVASNSNGNIDTSIV